jgi:uncharacterized protein
MSDSREQLEDQLESYRGKLRGFNSYIKELNDMCAKHGTGKEHFEGDLREAEHNVKYYEGEIALIGELIEQGTGGATYCVFQDAAGEWRWHLRAANNRIIAALGEGYQHKQDCLHGIALVKGSKDAPVEEKQ